jgi:glutamyl-tRNA synthetase
MLHPGDPARGTRTLEFKGTAMVPRSEITPASVMVRLKDLFNVTLTWEGGVPSFSYAGDSLEKARAAKAHIIQWLPEECAVPCTLLTQSGEITGACEPMVKNELGHVVQFERVGFAKIDSVNESGVRAYFTHK